MLRFIAYVAIGMIFQGILAQTTATAAAAGVALEHPGAAPAKKLPAAAAAVAPENAGAAADIPQDAAPENKVRKRKRIIISDDESEPAGGGGGGGAGAGGGGGAATDSHDTEQEGSASKRRRISSKLVPPRSAATAGASAAAAAERSAPPRSAAAAASSSSRSLAAKAEDDDATETESDDPSTPRSAAASSDDSSSSDSSDDSDSDNAPKHLREFAAKIKASGGKKRDEIITELNMRRQTFSSYLSECLRYGLLEKKDVSHLSVQFYDKVAAMIIAKKPREEILKFCAEKADNVELTRNPQIFLHKLMADCYKQGLLTPKQAAYLKLKNTVVERRGTTKERIIAFLNEQTATGVPTKTLNDLTDLFNASHHKVNRAIKTITLTGHVKELKEAGRLTDQVIAYYKSCTADGTQNLKSRQVPHGRNSS